VAATHRQQHERHLKQRHFVFICSSHT
jgi:hypothetical protein